MTKCKLKFSAFQNSNVMWCKGISNMRTFQRQHFFSVGWQLVLVGYDDSCDTPDCIKSLAKNSNSSDISCFSCSFYGMPCHANVNVLNSLIIRPKLFARIIYAIETKKKTKYFLVFTRVTHLPTFILFDHERFLWCHRT